MPLKGYPTPLCPLWPAGMCKLGDACPDEHPSSLDPVLPSRKEHPEYEVPNVPDVACRRCLLKGRECDREGRGMNDPCSECRWFAGRKRRCQHSQKSYNDHLWYVMLHRRKTNHNLPPPTSKSRQVSWMARKRVKHDWVGKSPEELRNTPDMIPAFVRELPRAYLRAPERPNFTEEELLERTQSQVAGTKRKRDSDESSNDSESESSQAESSAAQTSMPQAAGNKHQRDSDESSHESGSAAVPESSAAQTSMPARRLPPPFPRNSNTSLGPAVESRWVWATNTWEDVYESGFKLTFPPSAPYYGF